MRSLRAGPIRAHAALHLAQRHHPFVDKLLHPLTVIGLGGKKISLGVDSDAVNGIELARLPATIPKTVEFGHRLAIEDADPIVERARVRVINVSIEAQR